MSTKTTRIAEYCCALLMITIPQLLWAQADTTARIEVPSAFSPNGDQQNDLLHAIPHNIKRFRYLVVYNRYGEQVFYTNNPAVGWNGLYRQAEQRGTFVWMASGIDIRDRLVQRRGTVIILR
ncbi:gliding motility-associated C-terminal domain-containing protein [Paraflavitalea pollutisoli]|uniref:T9SS type B sorting domain-containing protein n=1 Tax=Paraflavitalea pollutisoli TaxID=3034143 RepID=UPI0023EACB8C|nr:gliding motility-associated C-terminal domain-containing protein [Paraflavitalea sp. H1-2-19X]